MEGRKVHGGGGGSNEGWKVEALIKERIEQLDVKEKLCIINPNLKRLIKIHLHL